MLKAAIRLRCGLKCEKRQARFFLRKKSHLVSDVGNSRSRLLLYGPRQPSSSSSSERLSLSLLQCRPLSRLLRVRGVRLFKVLQRRNQGQYGAFPSGMLFVVIGVGDQRGCVPSWRNLETECVGQRFVVILGNTVPLAWLRASGSECRDRNHHGTLEAESVGKKELVLGNVDEAVWCWKRG
eukprot:3327814-Rhodomonas_salina.2